jgi:kynurenine formamidase
MKQLVFDHKDKMYEADLESGVDLSIPFGHEESYSAWGSPGMQAEPVRYGDWIGSVEAGAAVNFYDLRLNPHGNGTHTEWAGHIMKERGSVTDQIRGEWFLAFLVEGRPDASGCISEPELLVGYEELPPALVLRTTAAYQRPADRNFTGTAPPFLSPSFVHGLRKRGVDHLLIDLPSVDPEEDEGRLEAHRAFWFSGGEEWRPHATITEFIQVSAELEQGLYLLHLQLAPLTNDASPSRPILYPVKER